MNRRLLLQITTPMVLIGLLLLGACLVSAWYVNKLQANLASILSQNVLSQEAAQELEIKVRQLRFHSFLYLIDPTAARREVIVKDHENFEKAFQVAKSTADTEPERRCVEEIEAGYKQYNTELEKLLSVAVPSIQRTELAKLMDAHPVQHVVGPSQELLRINKNMMEETSQESQRVAGQAQLIMIVLGLIGPISGIIIGYGISRGLSRSIYQLSVRVSDIANRLEQNVASVRIEADGDLHYLDRQLQYVVRQVEEVTERQQKHQQEMLRAEQLAAVGQLAASVAHEIRNPLTSIKMLVDLANRQRDPKSLTPKDLAIIHAEVARLENTVQGFLDFARLPKPQRTECDLREIIAQSVDLIRARAKQQKIELEVKQPDCPVITSVDRGQFCTVMVNLCINAVDAMPLGGKLEIKLDANAGKEIVLSISDTGSGIASEFKDRLFTPFASTKPTGTGLGLSISRRIVDEHGGSIEAANKPEGGACFTICLSRNSKPVLSNHSNLTDASATLTIPAA